jgi:NhaC family Na+:H+ antiporter
MLCTTTPAWLIGLIVYFFVGRSYGAKSFEGNQMDIILETVRSNFQFHWLLLLPPILILYFAVRKKPTIPGMIITSLLATLLGLVVQKVSLKNLVLAMTLGYQSNTGVEVVDRLFTRGGMAGMMHVTLIAFCAFSFAGIVQKAGMLDVLLDRLLKVARSTGSLIAATVASGVAVALMTGSSFLTILIPGELFAPAYKARGLAAKNLSRTTEDSGTVVVPLVPWSMAGVFMGGTLGVPTLSYLPWAVMCYMGMIFALIYGFTGFAIAPKIRDDETIVGS